MGRSRRPPEEESGLIVDGLSAETNNGAELIARPVFAFGSDER